METSVGSTKTQVSRRAFNREAPIRSHGGPCGICVGQTASIACFSPTTTVFLSQYHSTNAALVYLSTIHAASYHL